MSKKGDVKNNLMSFFNTTRYDILTKDSNNVKHYYIIKGGELHETFKKDHRVVLGISIAQYERSANRSNQHNSSSGRAN